MSKRAKIILIIIVLLVVIFSIWLLGGKIKEEKEAQNNRADYEQLLAEDLRLKDLVNNNLKTKGLLLEINEATTSDAFTVDQLNLITPKNELALREYGQQIAVTLKPYGEPRENELSLVLDLLKNSESNNLTKLTKIRILYEQTITKLLAINVPKNAQVIHLKLINSLARLAKNIDDMSQILDEPKLALQSSNIYIENMVLFFQAVESVNVFFSKQNIIFEKNENINIYDSLGLIQQY